MKKRLLCMALITLIMAGCSSPSETTAPMKESAEATSGLPKLENMELLTGSASGSWLTIGAGIADKINENYDGFPITTIPGPGSIGNPPVIAAGDAEIGMSYAAFLMSAENGNAPYEESYTNLRSIAALQPTVIHAIADSDETSVNDIISKKVPVDIGLYPTGNASTYLANSIFAASGMDDINEIESYGGSIFIGDGASIVDAWKDRHINMFFSVLNVPAAAVSESLVSRDGKLLSIDGDVATMLVEDEGFSHYTIKAGSYPEQEEDIQTVGLPMVVFVTDEMSDDIAYNITKSIYENKEYFEGVHSSFGEFNPETMADSTGLTLHPGAIKFYEEKGIL